MKIHTILDRTSVAPILDRASAVSPGRGAPILERAGRAGALAVPPTLVALAALHAAWALGWRWPGGDDRGLAERVLSRSERERLGPGALPSAPLTWTVAAALLSAAGIVRAAGGGAPRPVRGAAWAVSAVFLARGALSIPADLAGGPEDAYQRLDLAIYSPLSLALGAGTAAAVARSGAHGSLKPLVHG
jgi:Protein of unknown function (DUF3995)